MGYEGVDGSFLIKIRPKSRLRDYDNEHLVSISEENSLAS
jgi:hypothetical protein